MPLSAQQYAQGYGQVQQQSQQQGQYQNPYPQQQKQQGQGQGQPQQPQQELEKKKPFMAEGFDDYGQPHYGGGFKGWAKGTFARIYDPANRIANIEDPELRNKAQSSDEINKYAQEFNNLTKWDSWGEGLFGISSKDFGATKAAAQAEVSDAKLQGESVLGTIASSAVQQGMSAVKEVGMTALGAFGVLDYAHRKLIMVKEANYALAQETDLYKAAQEGGVPEFILGRGAEWEVPVGDKFTIDSGFVQETPLGLANPATNLRAGFHFLSAVLDKDTRSKMLDTYGDYLGGSGMAYTMVTDAKKREQFAKAVNEGEDPALAAANLGNFWTELGGSILGDPSTYMGVGIIGKGKTLVKIPFFKKPLTVFGKQLSVPWQKIGQTPTFGELLGIGASTARKAKAADTVSSSKYFNELDRFDEVQELVKGFDGNTDDLLAKNKMNETFTKVIDGIDAWDNNLKAGVKPNVRTLTTASVKASTYTRNVTNAIRQIAGNGGSFDDVLENLTNLRTMFKGASKAERMQGAAMAIKTHGQLALSDSYMQLGKFLAEFENDKDILKMIDNVSINPTAIADPIMKKVEAFANKFYPSMDEMHDASKLLTDKADDVLRAQDEIAQLQRNLDNAPNPKAAKVAQAELNRAQKAFDNNFGKAQKMKEMYEELNPFMRRGREMLRKYEEKFHRPVKKYMDTVFLGLRPANYMRNLQSQTFLIAMDLGFVDAIEIAAKTAVRAFKDDATERLLLSNMDEVKKVLGFIPESMTRGVNAAGETNKSFGFLRVSGNIDTLMSSEITLRVARKELQKVMNAGEKIFKYDELAKVFSPDEVSLVKNFMRENGGDVKKAIEELKKVASDGKIEAWRYLPMPPALKDFTQNTKLKEGFDQLQRTAATRDEFRRGVNELMQKAVEQTRKGAIADPPVVDEMTNETVREAFIETQELMSKGLVDEVRGSVFTNTTNAYEYMRRNIENAGQQFQNAVTVKADGAGIIGTPPWNAATKRLNDAQNLIHDVYPVYNKVASQVRDVLKEMPNASSLERAKRLDNAKFDVLRYTGKSLDELGKLPKRDFEKLVWDGYTAWQQEYWKGANMASLQNTVAAMEELAGAAGIRVEDIVNTSSELRNTMQSARRYQQQAAQWESRLRYAGNSLGEVANAYGLPTISETGVPINKTIVDTLNKNLPKGIEPFKNYKDAQSRMDDARIALANWKKAKGGADEITTVSDKIGEIVGEGGQVDEAVQVAGKGVDDDFAPDAEPANPYYNESGDLVEPLSHREIPPVSRPGTATGAQELHEHLVSPQLQAELKAWVDSVTDEWGSIKPTGKFDDGKAAAVKVWSDDANLKMQTIRAKVSAFATAQRDDLLLTYDKNMADTALAYLKPYHYWQTQQYMKTFARFADHPSWANGYLQYKEAMAKEHKDLPEWWKYNIPIKGLPGIEFESPLYVNLESMLNPIYDLTGTDFNDPHKRKDWVSRLVDDLGKTGGSFGPPVQWLVAAHLYKKGEDDAASRWMGRGLGQAGMAVKSGLTALGMDVNLGKFVQHNEIDPFVNFLQDGVDPNERKRVGRAISAMVQNGEITQEQAIDAMYSQSGDLYEAAKMRSYQDRSGAELTSFFLGIGWKPRTEQDAQIDTFYSEYSKLLSQRDLMPPEQYKQAWDMMRDKYKFMDAVLLSGKATDDRDRAFAFNVLGRLPPSTANEVLQKAGLTQEEIQQFYDTKGFSDIDIDPLQRQRFMNSVTNLSAMLAIPKLATRQEWNYARAQYGTMRNSITAQFGEDIYDKRAHFYTLTGQEREDYRQAHPELEMSKQFENQYILGNPALNEYYGGIETLEQFHRSNMYTELNKQFGDLRPIMDEYSLLKLTNPVAAKAYKRAHPEIAAWNSAKQAMEKQALADVLKFAQTMPEGEGIQLREDFTPQNPTQQDVYEYAMKGSPTAAEFNAELGQPMMQILEQYYVALSDNPGTAKLPYQAANELKYKAQYLGYQSDDDLLRDILLSIQQQQGQYPQYSP